MPEFRFGVVRHIMLDVVLESDSIEAATGHLGEWMSEIGRASCRERV